MIRFYCTCGRELQSPDELAGHPYRCPSCNEVRMVPRRPAPWDGEHLEPPAVNSGSAQSPGPADGPAGRTLSRSGRSRGRTGGPDAAFTVFHLVLIVGVVGLTVGMLLPRMHSQCGPAPRTQSANNLKQLGLAVFNYAANTGKLPPAGGGEKMHPGLSWRVAILPYIEEDVLYGQFHLDEPWDSPHNKQLLTLMPRTFVIPGANDPPGTTRYRVFVGKGAAFEPPEPGAEVALGRPAQDLPKLRGMILIVEAADAVPWTKPDELEYDPAGPLPRLHQAAGGPRAVMTDGSLRVLDPNTPDETLRALIAGDGEE